MWSTITPSTAPVTEGRGAPARVLRLVWRGQRFDWLNIDELDNPPSEDFVKTLRNSIQHYFNVPLECQACLDEDGPLATVSDYLRLLKGQSPIIRLYDLREMPAALKAETGHQLSRLLGEVVWAQGAFGAQAMLLQEAAALHSPAVVAPGPMAQLVAPPQPPRFTTPPRGALPQPTPLVTALSPLFTAPLVAALPPVQVVSPGAGPPGRQGQPVAVSPGPTHGGPAAPARCLGTPVACARPPSAALVPGTLTPLQGRLLPAPAAPPAGAAELFDRVDANRDGVVSRGEFSAALRQGAIRLQAPVYPTEPTATALDYKPCSATKMAPGYKEPDKVTGSVTRPDDALTKVRLAKAAAGETYGFEIDPTMDNTAATITYIEPSGPLAEWNRNNPGQAVREGDVIVCVNWLSNSFEAMKMELGMSGMTMLANNLEAIKMGMGRSGMTMLVQRR